MTSGKPLLLLIESSTFNCSVAISAGDEVIDIREKYEKNIHSRLLTSFIEELLSENNLSIGELRGVVVSKGPGSYTGLRIGVMAAKGIVYGADIPLVAVNTLKALSYGFNYQKTFGEGELFCPMIDARRMEVYYAIFDDKGSMIVNTRAEIIDEKHFDFVLNHNTVHFFGENVGKAEPLLVNKENAIFHGAFHPSAAFLAGPGYELFTRGNYRDPALFEPFYLKDFVPQHPEYKIKEVIRAQKGK